MDPADCPHSRPDWELHRQTDFAKDPNVRRRPDDYPLNNDETPITPLMFNAVGGSTIHWSGPLSALSAFGFPGEDARRCGRRLAAQLCGTRAVLRAERCHGGGWPGCTATRRILHGHRAPRRLRTWDRPARPNVRGLDKLGWLWWPSDTALITRPFGTDRLPCKNCGPCDLGRPRGAMSSAHVTY